MITQGQYQLKAAASSKNSDSKRAFRISRHRKVAPMSSIETSCSTGAPEPFQFSQVKKYKGVLFDSNTQRPATPGVRKRQIHRSSLVDRTSRIMFSVTMVFLLSWLPPWILAFYERSVKQLSLIGRTFVYFGEKTFIVNTFANPIFYIWLSSAFKERAITVLKCMRIRQRR